MFSSYSLTTRVSIPKTKYASQFARARVCLLSLYVTSRLPRSNRNDQRVYVNHISKPYFGPKFLFVTHSDALMMRRPRNLQDTTQRICIVYTGVADEVCRARICFSHILQHRRSTIHIYGNINALMWHDDDDDATKASKSQAMRRRKIYAILLRDASFQVLWRSRGRTSRRNPLW